MDNSYYESFFELTKGNYYSILGVPPKASQEEIKAAYRNAVKLYHPDLNNNREASRQQFIRVQQAYEVLSDPQQRARYDAELQRRLELFLRGAASQNNKTNTQQQTVNPTPTDSVPPPKSAKKIFFALIGCVVLIFAISIVWENPLYRDSLNQTINDVAEWLKVDNPATNVTEEDIQNIEPIDSDDNFMPPTTAPQDNDNHAKINALLGYRAGETGDNAASAAKNAQTGDSSPAVQPSVSLATGAKPYAAMYGSGRYDSESMSYLEVKNSVETDAIVMLYDTRTGRVVRHAYLRAGATYKLRQLPSGIFDMRVYQGVNWNPNKYMGPNAPTGGFESEESFTVCRPADYLDMRHTESYNGVSYPTYTVTLYTVRNGNFAMEETSSKTFFQ